MKIADVISALKTYLSGLTWTSDDGSGTTQLQAVFTYPNWVSDEGYPYAVILDESGNGEGIGNMTLSFDTTISIYLCVNYAIIDKQTEEEMAEEAMLRLREAWDYIKTQLFKKTTITTLGVDWDFNPSFDDEFDATNNVYKRRINLLVKEAIGRV